MTDFQDMAPEFSRPLAVDAIGPNGSVVELEADPEERRRLAERFDLLAIDRLAARLVVTRGASGIPIRVTGRLKASVVQHCVATLDPVASEIDEPVEAEYAPAAADGGEEVIDLNQPDPPEPLEGDRIELGELVAQHLSVALDPYPRKKGIEPLDWSEPQRSEDGSDPDNPFSVLAPLRKKRP
jgi:uncharacterized metal-binding protein YceD (DUF177 family)